MREITMRRNVRRSCPLCSWVHVEPPLTIRSGETVMQATRRHGDEVEVALREHCVEHTAQVRRVVDE